MPELYMWVSWFGCIGGLILSSTLYGKAMFTHLSGKMYSNVLPNQAS